VRDAQGRVYCHLHPDGYWLPGGASNTGAGPLAREFGEGTLLGMSGEAAGLAPVAGVVYPLVGKGERMPLACPEAVGFEVERDGGRGDTVARLAAWMQGQVLVERWCFELCEELGCEVGEWVAVTGGASRNDEWVQLRSDVLGRQLRRPAQPYAAYGAALLALAGVTGERVSELTGRLVTFECSVDPRPGRGEVYRDALAKLKEEVRRRWG
jgi:sugar (pentulose or hexulose) kinase